MRILLVVLSVFFLGGCDLAKPRPGEWEIASRLGTASGPAVPDQKTKTTKQCIGAAHTSSRDVILAMTGNRCKDQDARIGFGHIGGVLHCPGSYDISDYDAPISGAYGPDRLHITLDMPVFGVELRQTIDARRIGDCRTRGRAASRQR